MEEEQEVVLNVKWQKRNFSIELGRAETVSDLRARLFSLTDVLVEHQKLIGLPSVSMRVGSKDETRQLGSLKLKPEHSVLLVGTPSEEIAALEAHANAALDRFDVFDDLEDDLASNLGDRVVDMASARRRLERRIATTNIQEINPPREGKRLLMLDIDFTVFDCKSTAPTVAELGRPGLHEFLASVYVNYDIIIWSQTSWRWLEAKITELGMLMNPEYKLMATLDRTSMFAVTSIRNAKRRTHEVKALEVIWRKYPERYSAKNSIAVDDLRRNFMMNPQSGLRISPFKNAPVTRATDRELYSLEKYLRLIAEKETDFTTLDHSKWKDYCKKNVDSSSASNGHQ